MECRVGWGRAGWVVHGTNPPKHAAMQAGPLLGRVGAGGERGGGQAGGWMGWAVQRWSSMPAYLPACLCDQLMCPSTYPPPSSLYRLKSAFGLTDDPSRMYGVTEEEAQSLLAAGRTEELMDKVFAR